MLVVGDCEFGAVEVLRQLDRWHWDYVLRQKTSTHICLAQETEWQDFGKCVQKAGQSLWLGKGYLTESQIYPVNLLAHWQIGEAEPWLSGHELAGPSFGFARPTLAECGLRRCSAI